LVSRANAARGHAIENETMPRRNLTIVLLTVIISMVCYERADRTPYATVFGRVLHLVTERYVERVEPREVFEGAMEGVVDRLDEHSAYIGPEAVRQFQAELDQEFGGVGIEVSVDRESKRLMVMSPLLDTPAHEAGIRAGDIILKIDDQDTKGMTLSESVKLMRGKPGTKVKLTIRRQGEDEPLVLDIRRAIIQTDSVLGDLRDASGRWQYYLDENPRIGYIRLTTFGEHTVDELRQALQFKNHPVDALILDLRNNAGGLLPAAVDVCDMFLSAGRIVSSRGRDGQNEKVYDASPRATIVDPNIPVVVLVNRYSASASEIVAACLKDHGRAKIVGTRTWGKGTVQNVIELEGGKSVLKLTTAHYWRPSNQNIHRRPGATEDDPWGVKPDRGFEVKLSKEEFERVFLERRERDVVRMDEAGVVQPPRPSPPNGDTDDPQLPEEGSPGEESPRKKDRLGDPQLRRAIEYIEGVLAKRRAAA
jgi:carboxyl-terminal processing protease